MVAREGRALPASSTTVERQIPNIKIPFRSSPSAARASPAQRRDVAHESPSRQPTSARMQQAQAKPNTARLQRHMSASKRISTVRTPASPSYPVRSNRHRAETREPPPEDRDANDDEPICEYDTNATVLYELLESSNWDQARTRCRSHPEETRTWIVRKDRSLQVRWKLLPLHAAIIFQSPNFLVATLLEKYPAAASRRDDQGMLPLHLAFRHKQEDEDLLELLLCHYPKAVLIKDRRDRVPLEHGRESKFSAKLMRLYADATIAASRANSGKEETTPEPSHLTNAISASKRAMIEADHEDAVVALKNDYEGRMNKLKEAQEARLAALKEEHKVEMRQAKLVSDDERQTLVDQHNDEISELRDLLTSQVGKDKMLSEALEKELAHLEVEMQDVRRDNDQERSKNKRLKAYIDDLQTFLEKVAEENTALQELFAQQEDDMAASLNIRNELIQTLLDQESQDAEHARLRGTKMIEIGEKMRQRVEHAMCQPIPRVEASTPHMDTKGSVGGRIPGLSRLERERGEEHKTYADIKRDRDLERNVPDKATASKNLDRNTPPRSDDVGDRYRDLAKRAKDHGFATAQHLGDEISAITENSDY